MRIRSWRYEAAVKLNRPEVLVYVSSDTKRLFSFTFSLSRTFIVKLDYGTFRRNEMILLLQNSYPQKPNGVVPQNTYSYYFPLLVTFSFFFCSFFFLIFQFRIIQLTFFFVCWELHEVENEKKCRIKTLDRLPLFFLNALYTYTFFVSALFFSSSNAS